MLAIASLTGCQTAGFKKADSAAASLQNAATEVQAENQTLDLSMATLRDLVNKPSGDLKVQYQRFSKSVDKLESAVARNERAATRVSEKHAAYLASWDKELGSMNYEAIRLRSEARKNEVSAHFETVNRRYNEARAAMQPLVDYLKDIRTALSTDLTPAGLESVKPILSNAEENAGKVQVALGRLTNELNNSSTRISSVAWQTATPGTNEPPAR